MKKCIEIVMDKYSSITTIILLKATCSKKAMHSYENYSDTYTNTFPWKHIIHLGSVVKFPNVAMYQQPILDSFSEIACTTLNQ